MTEKYLWWEYTNSFLESSSEGPKDARENVVFVTLQKVFFGADKSPKEECCICTTWQGGPEGLLRSMSSM